MNVKQIKYKEVRKVLRLTALFIIIFSIKTGSSYLAL